MRLLLALGTVFAALAGARGSHAQILPAEVEGSSHRSRTWEWRDYRAHRQNWDVTQGAGGVIFAANSNGVLEYDGEEWRLHTMPDEERTLVRSVATDESGRLYVGGIGDFGMLRPSSSGFLEYQSLREHIPEADREFADVWRTHVSDAGVVFQTAERLFRWDGERVQSWATDTRFRTAFEVNGDVYVWEEGAGLMALGAEAILPLPGGGAFAERKVEALLPHSRGLLVVVRNEGLVLLVNGQEQFLDTDASAYLRDFRPYTGVEVPDPYTDGGRLYAVSTIGGGIATVSPEGRLVRVYREDVGLTNADLNVGLHLDNQGGLWVARLDGLTRIDLFARLTRFDETTGLEGSIYTLVEHENQLYVGTSNGLYRLVAGSLGRPASGPSYASFAKVDAMESTQTLATLSTPHGLLVGTLSGIWVLDGARAYRVTSSEAFAFLHLSQGEGRVLFGSKDGVGRLVYRDGRWVSLGRVEGVSGEIRHLEEDAAGGVWVSELNGILSYLSDLAADLPTVQQFGPEQGLSVSAGPLVRQDGDVWMAPREGVFSIEIGSTGLQLEPVAHLDFLQGIYGLYGTDADAGLWVNEGGALYAVEREDQGRPSLQLRDAAVIDLLATEAGVLWIGTADGLLRYDPRVEALGQQYTASVRMVTDRERVPLYAGAGSPSGSGPLEVPYGQSRQVRFEVAAPFFDAPGAIEYQYRLDGFDDDWGAWSEERVASYTNLWPGAYTLHVRARDLNGNVSSPAVFPFHVVPPWYLRWWAYSIYAVAVVILIWGLITWRGREHRRKLTVQRARSTRFQRLSTRLEKTNARLRQADKLKDDLLANTSHELRTPLTAILGFSEMLLDEVEGENQSLAQGIHRGGQRLLTTVNGLLDMFKLQSGTMPVEARDVDAARAVRESVELLQPLAAARQTDLLVLPEGITLPSTLDPDLLDRVVTNLVSNAVKFTEGGRVLVLVDGDEQTLRISVQDTGIGIAPDDLERILEPFEQASRGFSRSHEGTGLGLAIVQRVLALVGGHLRFESEVGIGTAARVTIPRHWASPSSVAPRTEQGLHPGLDGVHVLGVGLSPSMMGAVRRAVGTQGVVAPAESPGRALREARATIYDVFFIGAEEEGAERKLVRALRALPGYAHVPIVRLGGEELSPDDVESRGLTDHLPDPVEPGEVGASIETVLSRVDALADVLAPV